MNAELIDGRYTIAAMDIEIRVDMAVSRYIRDTPSTVVNMDTASLNIEMERPRTAVDRRQVALAVFLYKHSCTDYDYAQIHNDIQEMRKLGRTDRWQNALITLDVVTREAAAGEHDMEWALHQYVIYANYASL